MIGCVPGGSVVKNPLANAGDTGDTGSNPELGRPPRRGNGNPLSFDRGAWQATAHEVTKSQSQMIN